MENHVFYIPKGTSSLDYARKQLKNMGVSICDFPCKDTTHVLLNVPSFQPGGLLRDGTDLRAILDLVSKDVVILGGNLHHPLLRGRKTIDLLQDDRYLAENAAITADCAVQMAAQHMSVVWRNCPVLVVGWGRIGKCLSALLAQMGVNVTVFARKAADQSMLWALGYHVVEKMTFPCEYRVIFNTAPAPVISAQDAAQCRKDCIKLDLASSLGIEGEDVIWARGLPGVYAPESAGILIGQTAIRLTQEEVNQS